jgi:rare lipoprotein A (peptidoglycan hydrolase)
MLDLAKAPRLERLWLLRLLHWGGLALALTECRTPPPIPRTPADSPEAQALVPDEEPPAHEAPQGETRAHEVSHAPSNVDYSGEQRELAERYGRRRSEGVLHGEASYYGGSFAGRKTASGEVFEPRRYTAAHRTLPFGTVLRVTRLDTRAIVYVRVNDRGPYGKKGRILDLSTAAAEQLGMLSRGIADVRADIVERGVTLPKKTHSSHSH